MEDYDRFERAATVHHCHTSGPGGAVDLPHFFQYNSPLHKGEHFVAQIAEDTVVYMLKRFEGGGEWGSCNEAILKYARICFKDDAEDFIEKKGATSGRILFLPTTEEAAARENNQWIPCARVDSPGCSEKIAKKLCDHLKAGIRKRPNKAIEELNFAVKMRIVK